MTDNLRGAYKWEETLYKDMIDKNLTERSTVGIVCNMMLETLLKLPGVPQTGTLLEIGSGDGYNTVSLARWGYDIRGIEVSASAVQLAQDRLKRENIQNAQVEQMDATAISFDDNSFDVVVDATCLHCIVDLEDRRQVFSEVQRVLKPSGSFLGATMSLPYVGTLPDSLQIEDEIMYTESMVKDDPNLIPVRIVRELDSLKAELAENRLRLVWYKHEIIRPQAISHHFVYHAQKGN